MEHLDAAQLQALKDQAQRWAVAFGFAELRVCDTDVSEHAERFRRWLDAGYHGEMGYMAEHEAMRLQPELLLPGTLRVLVARMRYLPEAAEPLRLLESPSQGYISRYATGRDYHKVVRRRLARLAAKLNDAAQAADHRYRAFADSAPVLEKALAVKSGHGWVGKNSLVLNEADGSWFFLGEIFTNLPLPVDASTSQDRCGACNACRTVCPTDAILPDRTIDARRCVSYLTIEHKSSIDEALRPLLGNRIFGCDDCQLYCPWNRDAPSTSEPDFLPRAALAAPPLVELIAWSEAEFLARTEGTPLRRLSFEQWQRNVAIAIGNAPYEAQLESALIEALPTAGPMAAEHLRWALDQLMEKKLAR